MADDRYFPQVGDVVEVVTTGRVVSYRGRSRILAVLLPSGHERIFHYNAGALHDEPGQTVRLVTPRAPLVAAPPVAATNGTTP